MKLTKKHLHIAIVSGALIAMGFIFLLKPHHVPKKEDIFAGKRRKCGYQAASLYITFFASFQSSFHVLLNSDVLIWRTS